MIKNISVLGSTGSIGVKALKIAKNLGISRSYVSRTEKRAITKMLKELLKNKN